MARTLLNVTQRPVSMVGTVWRNLWVEGLNVSVLMDGQVRYVSSLSTSVPTHPVETAAHVLTDI